MKNLLTVLIALIVLLFATTVQAQTKGSIDFEVEKTSNTGIEDLSVDADFQVINGNTKTEIDFVLNKVQTADKLDSLDVDAAIEYGILLTKQVFTFAKVRYYSDTGYDIKHSTAFGIGAGYFPGLEGDGLDYNIQAGLYLDSKYFADNTFDRIPVLGIAGEIDYPLNDTFSLFGDGTIDFNIDDIPHDYESMVDGGLKVVLAKGENVSTNLKIHNEWKHNHLAAVEDQKVYGVKLGVEF